MINEIIRLCNSHEWLNVSENVEIAKGKYKAPNGFKDVKRIFRRRILSWLIKLSGK
jgi:hypothetical protein